MATKEELKNLCRKNNLKGFSTLNKEELIKKLNIFVSKGKIKDYRYYYDGGFHGEYTTYEHLLSGIKVMYGWNKPKYADEYRVYWSIYVKGSRWNEINADFHYKWSIFEKLLIQQQKEMNNIKRKIINFKDAKKSKNWVLKEFYPKY